MNGNLSDYAPLLQEKAGALYHVSVPLAAVLVLGGLIVAISRAGSDPAALLRAILGVGIIALSIAYFPDWSNTAQDIAHGIIEELGANPSQSHENFARYVAGVSADGDEKAGLWDVLFSGDGGIGHAMLYAAIFLLSKLASAIMWLFFVLQQALIQFQIGFAPIFLAMFLVGPLRSVALQFQMSFAAVLLWPLGWAIASLMTDTILQLAATNRIYRTADGLLLGGPQTFFFTIVLSVWVLFSTIGAPLVIRKLLTTGANAGAVLLSNVGMALTQSALYGTSAGATTSMAGGSAGASSGVAAAAVAGGAISGALGSNGVFIPSAIGVGAALAVSSSGSPTGDSTARAHELAKQARTS